MNDQITTSIFDTDWYKFLEFFYKYYFHRDVVEVYGTHNRTKAVKTAQVIPVRALLEQLSALQTVHFEEWQIAFLKGTGAFAKDPLGFERHLRSFRFSDFDVRVVEDQLVVETPDLLAETFVMNYINGLLNHYRAFEAGVSSEKLMKEAERTLLAKIPTLRKLPEGSVLEFGSRRRFSGAWQHRELEILLNTVPKVVTATSNVQLAIDFGIPWAGTHPHAGTLLEQLMGLLFILHSGDISHEEQKGILRESHMKFFKNWWSVFPYVSRVALTDTYGDEAFWQDWTQELAYEGRGYRWDSGDWRIWTDRTVEANRALGIDLTDRYSGKDAVYSDGLDPEEMLRITEYAKHLFRLVLFGWGTDGSNDMGGYKKFGFTPISLVMKPIYGVYEGTKLPLIKISNNPAKMTEAPEERQRLVLETFGYNLNEHEYVQPIV